MKTINFQIYERNGGHTHFSLADTECRMINCRLRIEIYWNGMAHDRTTKSAFINFWWAKANQNTAAAPNNSNNSQHHFGQILWLNTVFSWGSAGTIIWIIMTRRILWKCLKSCAGKNNVYSNYDEISFIWNYVRSPQRLATSHPSRMNSKQI